MSNILPFPNDTLHTMAGTLQGHEAEDQAAHFMLLRLAGFRPHEINTHYDAALLLARAWASSNNAAEDVA